MNEEIPKDLKEFLDKCKMVDMDTYQKALMEGSPLICTRVQDGPSLFEDNTTAKCVSCDAELWMRPYNAMAVNILCMFCAMKLMEAGNT